MFLGVSPSLLERIVKTILLIRLQSIREVQAADFSNGTIAVTP
jgi:hypothetical protein